MYRGDMVHTYFDLYFILYMNVWMNEVDSLSFLAISLIHDNVIVCKYEQNASCNRMIHVLFH